MAIRKIVHYGEPSLREPSKEVHKVSKKISELVRDLLDTMYAQNGVGLAAPQIGENVRVFVIDVSTGNEPLNPIVFINPKIIKKSGQKKIFHIVKITVFIANMNDKIRLCCPCHFGLESVLKYEITKIGGTDLKVCDGKISFTGDLNIMARANLCLSTAERVLIELIEFRAETFEDLFQGVRSVELERYIGIDNAFPVKGYSLNSTLHSVPDCQKIVKKAAVERLKAKYGVSWFNETEPPVQIQFSILKDVVTIYLDTSGAGLHKRGYRRNSNAAPIKETLAAGIVDLARVRPESIVCDPFCGSGTTGIAANLLNRRFLGIDNEVPFLEMAKARREELENPDIRKAYASKIKDIVLLNQA